VPSEKTPRVTPLSAGPAGVIALPGLSPATRSAGGATAASGPKPAPAPGFKSDLYSPNSIPAEDTPSGAGPNALQANNPWAQRQGEAIKIVTAKTLPDSLVTVGSQARTLLAQMHEKELLHAADTGERLYLPDKMTWAALEEEGPRYRVYLNFLAMQATGERIQARSYQFIVDLKTKDVRADDPATQEDLLTHPAEARFKHNPMATDIDSILGGVDTFNKHKVRLLIVRKNSANSGERKKIEAAVNAAQTKVKRAVVYFRRTYPDSALQNVAKAYSFTDLVNGK